HSGHHRGVPRPPQHQSRPQDSPEAEGDRRAFVRQRQRQASQQLKRVLKKLVCRRANKTWEKSTMTNFTLDRRSLLKGGALTLATAAAMSADELLGYAKAWAQTSPWKPEAGAKINLLRWKRFVESEDVAFM